MKVERMSWYENNKGSEVLLYKQSILPLTLLTREPDMSQYQDKTGFAPHLTNASSTNQRSCLQVVMLLQMTTGRVRHGGHAPTDTESGSPGLRGVGNISAIYFVPCGCSTSRGKGAEVAKIEHANFGFKYLRTWRRNSLAGIEVWRDI